MSAEPEKPRPDVRILIQYMISVKTISQDLLAEFWKKYLCEIYMGNTEKCESLAAKSSNDMILILEEAIHDINMNLFALHYEIKKHKDKSDDQMYYSFVNSTSDGPSKLNTGFSADEIKVIVNIIKSAIENSEALDNYVINSSEALNSYRQLTGKSMATGSNFFKTLVRNGWLISKTPGEFELGSRLLAELESEI